MTTERLTQVRNVLTTVESQEQLLPFMAQSNAKAHHSARIA